MRIVYMYINSCDQVIKLKNGRFKVLLSSGGGGARL